MTNLPACKNAPDRTGKTAFAKQLPLPLQSSPTDENEYRPANAKDRTFVTIGNGN